jgi:hypothetical protein
MAKVFKRIRFKATGIEKNIPEPLATVYLSRGVAELVVVKNAKTKAKAETKAKK